jgi:prepilin-type N-terminal cleavage/methylation domain-containing protein
MDLLQAVRCREQNEVNKKLTNRKDRVGFTLVEMLVVLLIIVILAGLISAVTIRGLHRAKVAAIGVEINQLSMALEKYKTELGGEYPPDFSDLSSNGQTLILRHIARAFPHYSISTWANLRTEILNTTNPAVDINTITLNPSTALRFWLGGMSDAQGRPIGFSKDPAHPFDNTTSSRIGPFFEFDPGRLQNNAYYAPGIIAGTGQPYIYLRAELGQPEPKREYYNYNGTSYTFNRWPTSGTQITQPYWDQRNMGWVNPASFQILCCGLDGKFGKENVYPTVLTPDWTPITGTIPADVLTALKNDVIGNSFPAGNFDHIDDQTNFTKGTIGDDLP